MCQLSFYQSEEISEHVTRVNSLTGEFLYLIKGENKALLIDTCLGVGDLRRFVENLTDKPMIVVLSHGHVDHAMGAPEFDQVYMNLADKEIFREHKALEIRKNYIQMVLADNMPSIEESDYVPPVEPHFNELKDGMVFDLGGINIEIFETPGHTPGSIAVYNKEKVFVNNAIFKEKG